MADETNNDQVSALQATVASLQSALDAIQVQMSELQDSQGATQQTTRRLQNFGSSGSGSVLGGTTNKSASSQSTLMTSGITIPFVSNIRAKILGITAGRTNVAIQWTDVPDVTGLIDQYNVWMIGSIGGQNQETLVVSSHVSPAVFSVPQGQSGTIQIGIQTQYKNGRTNNISECPFVSLALGAPQVNAADLNINGLFFGPDGTLTLSGFTFSNGTGTTISWSAGQVSYQGVTYQVSAGASSGTNYLIVWKRASPTVFTSIATSGVSALLVDDFMVAENTSYGSPLALGFVSPMIEVHNNTNGSQDRVNLLGDGVVGWNTNGNNTFALTRQGPDAASGVADAAGALRLFNGTQSGGLGSGVAIELDGITSYVSYSNSPGTPVTPTNGGTLYVVAGALWYIGSSGTSTKLAVA